MSSPISTRELDLIIKELERLGKCYETLSDRVDRKLDKIDRKTDTKVDKSNERWKYLMIFGSFAFTLFVLGLVLKLNFGI